MKRNYLQYQFDIIELTRAPMNITALRTFLAIVETGSLVRASERLNVTQSTVTSRLQGLEADLGKTLLYRQKSGVSLTSYGFRFRRYAEAMTDLWQQALQETAYQEGFEAVCDMASHPDLWLTLGRRILTEVQRDHPATVFSIWPGNPAQLEQWLSTGLIEAALSYRIATGENQTSHPLSDERLLLYSTDASVTDAPGPGYIHVDAGGDFRRRYTAAFADADFAKVSFGCAVWALEYLLEQGGSAYLPTDLAAPHRAAGKLHEVTDAPDFTRARYLITNDNAAANWPWLPALVERLAGEGA